MKAKVLSIVRTGITLILLACLIAACSSSSNSPSSSEQSNSNQSSASTGSNSAVETLDDANDASMATAATTQPSTDDATNTTAPTPLAANPTSQSATGSNQATPDPLSQSTTLVNFDIQVPVYQSDELQVRLSWGEKTLLAKWIGDELWSASGDYPTNTENLLVVTFFDANGEIPLGSVEQVFVADANASMSVQISAEQFDTNRWDSDNDGISNLEALLAQSQQPKTKRVLLFSETRGYRHESIQDALTAIEQLANSAGIQSDRADDSSGVFTAENLANYHAVVWVLTSGDVLNVDEQTAFENFIRAGGGYAGIHAASDTEYDWPWYGTLVGAYFKRHPVIQSAKQNVENSSHPSTAHLDLTWTRTDEWYDYSSNPRAQVNVLLSLDESSYSGGTMGEDHPSAWYHNYDGGRSWYTGGGHTKESYSEPAFLTHLLGGLRYAAGVDGF